MRTCNEVIVRRVVGAILVGAHRHQEESGERLITPVAVLHLGIGVELELMRQEEA